MLYDQRGGEWTLKKVKDSVSQNRQQTNCIRPSLNDTRESQTENYLSSYEDHSRVQCLGNLSLMGRQCKTFCFSSMQNVQN